MASATPEKASTTVFAALHVVGRTRPCPPAPVLTAVALATLTSTLLFTSAASGQTQGGTWAPYPGQPPPGQAQPGYPPQQPQYGYAPPRRRSTKRTKLEMGTLYGTSVAYGVGVGIWLDSEFGVTDPGVSLILPAVLGAAAPVGIYFLDKPRMRKGRPAAIAAGAALGAGLGLGIAGYQMSSASDEGAWGFRGLSRSVTLGATLGGVGGYALAYTENPAPETAGLAFSGALWGTAVGSMLGYGATSGSKDFGEANDSAALGGLIGYNAGLLGAVGLTAAGWVPRWSTMGWMWAGAGIGAASSLPVFLFYVGDGGPPARRGFLFMGTATTLGLALGAVFSGGLEKRARADAQTGGATAVREVPVGTPGRWLRVDYVTPAAFQVADGAGGGLATGLQAGGVF